MYACVPETMPARGYTRVHICFSYVSACMHAPHTNTRAHTHTHTNTHSHTHRQTHTRTGFIFAGHVSSQDPVLHAAPPHTADSPTSHDLVILPGLQTPLSPLSYWHSPLYQVTTLGTQATDTHVGVGDGKGVGGNVVGRTVGNCDVGGSVVGISVGVFVGAGVGRSVGVFDGLGLGGFVVGVSVGVLVGEGVGSSVEVSFLHQRQLVFWAPWTILPVPLSQHWPDFSGVRSLHSPGGVPGSGSVGDGVGDGVASFAHHLHTHQRASYQCALGSKIVKNRPQVLPQSCFFCACEKYRTCMLDWIVLYLTGIPPACLLLALYNLLCFLVTALTTEQWCQIIAPIPRRCRWGPR